MVTSSPSSIGKLVSQNNEEIQLRTEVRSRTSAADAARRGVFRSVEAFPRRSAAGAHSSTGPRTEVRWLGYLPRQ